MMYLIANYKTEFSLLIKLFESKIVCALVSFFLLMPQFVHADEFDTFNFVADTSRVYHSNLFRVPDNVEAVPGKPRSDTIQVFDVGFTLNKSISLQKFKFSYTRSENKYDNFSYLNFSANNYNASWQWALTPYVTGVIQSDKTSSLAGFGDYRNFTIPNTRSIENNFVTIDISPLGNWHLIGALTNNSVVNSQVFFEDGNVDNSAVKVGLRYDFASTTSVEGSYTDRKGKYKQLVSTLPKDFDESQYDLKTKWSISEKSLLAVNVGYIDRAYQNFSGRNYSDLIGSISYNWKPSAKLTLSAGVKRESASFFADYSNFSQTDTLFMNPTWSVGAKLFLVGAMQISTRKFINDNPIQREDSQQSIGATLRWVPRPAFEVDVSAQRDIRHSTFSSFNFTDDVLGLSGYVNF